MQLQKHMTLKRTKLLKQPNTYLCPCNTDDLRELVTLWLDKCFWALRNAGNWDTTTEVGNYVFSILTQLFRYKA